LKVSEQNVDVVRTLYRETAHGDASGLQWLDERMALDYRAVPDLPSLAKPVDDPRWQPERFIDLHERVLVRVKFSGHARATGHQLETRIAHLWTVRRGRSVRLAVYHDWESGLEAAGVAE
jgi:ketosteroid isomerase-like protein